MKLDVGFVEIVSSCSEANNIVRNILNNHEYVAVDMEGVNLGDGPVTLVQISAMPYPTIGEERKRAEKYNLDRLEVSGSMAGSVFGAGLGGIRIGSSYANGHMDGKSLIEGLTNASSTWSMRRAGSVDDINVIGNRAESMVSHISPIAPPRIRTKSMGEKTSPEDPLREFESILMGNIPSMQSSPPAKTNTKANANAPLAVDCNVHPDVFLFDIQTNGALIWSLEPLFSSVNVVKVIHDARGDVRALNSYYGIRMRRLFDTQVADLIIQEHREGSLHQRRSSLNSIARMYGGVVNPYKDMVRELYYDRGYPYYDQRPLTMEMVYQAAHDVHSLIPNVYQNQIDQLRPGSDVWNRFINRMRAMVRVPY